MDEFEIASLEGEYQSARANLRERFLRLLTQLNGKECTVKMYENTKVTCRTRAYRPNMETVLVENLQTPLPQALKTAILRSNDIISIEYNLQ